MGAQAITVSRLAYLSLELSFGRHGAAHYVQASDPLQHQVEPHPLLADTWGSLANPYGEEEAERPEVRRLQEEVAWHSRLAADGVQAPEEARPQGQPCLRWPPLWTMRA